MTPCAPTGAAAAVGHEDVPIDAAALVGLVFRLKAELLAVPLEHVGGDRAAPDGVLVAGNVRLDGYAGALCLGCQYRLLVRCQHNLPCPAHIQDHARPDRPDRQRAAQVVVAAQHHRRACREPGRLAAAWVTSPSGVPLG